MLAQYTNGNTRVTIQEDGSKERVIVDPTLSANPVHPESIDVKITNWCDAGCPYCHEMSTKAGVHGDSKMLLDKLSELPAGVELACLSGDSVVFGQNGAVEIKDLNVGDFIFDSTHTLREVVSIKKTVKPKAKVKLTKTLTIDCSLDHPFLSSGELKPIEALVGATIDTLKPYEYAEHSRYIIDLARYIKSPHRVNRGGSAGGSFTENMVRLNHSCGWTRRYIELDNDIMWLYGLVIAEGSGKGIALNIDEEDLSDRALLIYKNIFGRDSNIFLKPKSNSRVVEFKDSAIYRTLFFDAMKIGTGARNKTLQLLFNINDKELVRSALFGLFQGDGCFRKRAIKPRYKSYNFSLKTTSKKLAYELVYLLKKIFDITASLYYGYSKERKIEDRLLARSDYFKIDIYGKENLDKLFPWVFAEDPDYQKYGNTKYSFAKTVNTVKVLSLSQGHDAELYDITLKDGSHIFPVNGYLLTHNCGGGDPLSHPDLLEILNISKSRGHIVNMTVNQVHLERSRDLLLNLIEKKLIYGLGISYSSKKYLQHVEPLLRATNNVVFHVIMGVNKLTDLDDLKAICDKYGRECRMLVLGYKQYGFGLDYYAKKRGIEDNKYQWYIGLRKYMGRQGFIISFDNLAIDQLNLKRYFLSEEEWNKFYMGNDFVFTMYMDAVKQEYAPSSTSKNRTSFSGMNLLEYFQKNRRNE